MKYVYCLLFMVLAFSAKSNAQAVTEPYSVDEQLFFSVVDQDFQKFEKYLSLGANPNAMIFDERYVYTAMCQATRPGNEQYLNAIINLMGTINLSATTLPFATPLNCAIRYKNFMAFKKFISMGADINAVVNPEFAKKFHRTLLDVAISARNPEVIFYILERAQPNDRQLSSLVRSLERFGGFEGTDTIEHFEKVAQWLTDNDIEVNLAAPAPDPRKMNRLP